MSAPAAKRRAPAKVLSNVFEAEDRIEFLFEGLIYLAFITIFTVALTMTRDSAAFRMTEQVEEIFTFNEGVDDGFLDIARQDDLWAWASGRLIPGIFDTVERRYLEPNTTADNGTTARMPGAIAGANMLVGWVQFRQLRVKKAWKGCQTNDGIVQNMKTSGLIGANETVGCLGDFFTEDDAGWFGSKAEASSEDKAPFGPVVPGETEKSYTYVEKKSVTYKSRGLFREQGYPAGGFVVAVPVHDKARFTRAIDQLRRSFVDEQTRVLFIDMALHTTNSKLWTSVRFTLEFPAIGGIVPSYMVMSAPTYVPWSPENRSADILEIIVLCFIAYYTWGEIQEMIQLQKETKKLRELYELLHIDDEMQLRPSTPYRDQWKPDDLEKAFKQCRPELVQRYTKFDLDFAERTLGLGLFRRPEIFGKVLRFQIPPGFTLYLSYPWNFIDWLNLVVFYYVIYCRCIEGIEYQAISSDIKTQNYLKVPTDFIFSIYNMANYRLYENQRQGLNIFLCWFRLFKYTKINPALNQLILVISAAANNIIFFSFVYFIVTLGFAYAGWIAFGSSVHAFRSSTSAFLTLFRAVNEGELYYEQLERVSGTVAPIFYIVYYVLTAMVLVNMFIAIITNAFTEVQRETKDGGGASFGAEIVEAITMKFKLALQKAIENSPANKAMSSANMAMDLATGSQRAADAHEAAEAAEAESEQEAPEARAEGFNVQFLQEYLQQDMSLQPHQARQFATAAFVYCDDSRSGLLSADQLDQAKQYAKDRMTFSDAGVAIMTRIQKAEAEIRNLKLELEKLVSGVRLLCTENAMAMRTINKQLESLSQ